MSRLKGFIHTITIWNKLSTQGQKDRWFKSIINDCSWEDVVVRSVSGSTANVATTTRVLIEKKDNYLIYEKWSKLSDDERINYFTFSQGDLVALGEHEEDITGVSPHTEALIKIALKPYVFNIKALSDQTESYKHGKHYEIEGV